MADSKLYKILGISKDASLDEIKMAHRLKTKLIKHRKDSKFVTEKTEELSFAWNILSNPTKRAIYDKYGIRGVLEEDVPEVTQTTSFFPFSNLFGSDEIYDMGVGGLGMRRLKTKDTSVELLVKLEDLYNGYTVNIPISREVICSKCAGEGGNLRGKLLCSVCQGAGQFMNSVFIAPGFAQRRLSACTNCKGHGTIFLDKHKCRQCRGQRVMQESESMQVNVDKGMRDGQKIKFAFKGNQALNMEPGDFNVILKQASHKTFVRAADDLVLKLKVSLGDALCGFEKVIKQLDGRDLHAKLKPGEILTPGCVRRIENEGMPMIKTPYLRGDLILKFEVEFPENHFCDYNSLSILENFLPPRREIIMPNMSAENVEEVTMFDLDPEAEKQRPRAEAYGSDDEESSPTSHMRCAHQ